MTIERMQIIKTDDSGDKAIAVKDNHRCIVKYVGEEEQGQKFIYYWRLEEVVKDVSQEQDYNDCEKCEDIIDYVINMQEAGHV